jgi:cytochrome oxidase complex assembly protein 1
MPDLDHVRHAPAPGEDYVPNNWWKVPGGCLVLLSLFIVGSLGVLSLIQFSLSRSGAYHQALDRARSHPIVSAQLGSPIRPGWFTSGQVDVRGPNGTAQLVIPVVGPKNHGTLFVVAEKKGGKWEFQSLMLAVFGRSDRIDLLKPVAESEPVRDF